MKRYFEKKHIGLVIGYFICYLLAFKLLEIRETKKLYMIHTIVDDMIPFCEYFIVFYFFWFLYVAAAVVYYACFQKNAREYWQFMISLGIGMTLFLLVSWIFPNGHDLRPVLPAEGNIFIEMVRALYRMDTSTNILPSIHVFNSLAVAVAIDQSESLRTHWLLRKSSWALALLIILSTMFLKQHSTFDVFCGIALYTAVYLVVYLRKVTWPIRASHKRKGWLLEEL